MKEKEKSTPRKPEKKRPVILLEDLVPRDEISGGSGKHVFGSTAGSKKSDKKKD
jgi:hypothetical protein